MRSSTATRGPQEPATVAEHAASDDGAAVHASSIAKGAAAPTRGGETIEQCIVRTLDQYFRDLDGARPCQLHQMVMQAVERPLLRFALERNAGNQSAAADLLGINRNTLRKKLIEHGMAEAPAPRPASRLRSTRATARSGSAAARRKR